VTKTAFALLFAVVLSAPGPAAAHPGTAGRGYVSTVAGLIPNVLGSSATVIGGDDRLRLSNYSGKTIVILGYEGEPYLRFDDSAVYENIRSPAVYLNRFRFPPPLTPGKADPRAKPRWRRVGRGLSFDWHDHRIHWAARKPPAIVKRDPGHTHLIFHWRVPGRADGKPFAITGFLGYAPPRGAKQNGTSWAIPVAGAVLGALALALGLVWMVRRGPAGGPSP
jgi:hypothetical protein